MIEDKIYDRLMDWARRTFNTGRDDLMNFEYEVQHQGLGELVQEMMAEAWREGFETGSDWEAYLARGTNVFEAPNFDNPYRKLIENDS